MSLTRIQGQLVSNTSVLTSNVITANSFIGSGALLSNITNASLVNTSITINGTTIALGGSGSIIAGATITDDNSTNATRYVMLGTETNGAYIVANTSSSKLLFNPSSGTLSTSNIAIGKTNYLCTQMSIIGENRFDEVLKFDTLIDDLKSVIEKYIIKLSGENVLDIHYHNSPHELDDLMIKYAKEKYQKIIEDYFYDDFSIYVDHSPLLKENK